MAQSHDGERGIRLLIADDHPLILAGLRRRLADAHDVDVVGEARSGPELVAMIDPCRPDMVLMDLTMPGFEGVQAVALVHARWPQLQLVVLSACDEPSTIDASLQAGASAYVVKGARAVDIAPILRQALEGAAPDALIAAPSELTDRERSVLEALASDMTPAAISQDLWLSQSAIELHLSSICRKLGVADRLAAVAHAREHGIA